MKFPERFSNLPDYAFPRLRGLLDVHQPGGGPIAMTIGEPRHAFPDWVGKVLAENTQLYGRYPQNNGLPLLLEAISKWIGRRYGVSVSVDQIMALNGSREGLYNAAMAVSPEEKNGQKPIILTPNPFYQVYAIAALAVGAEPFFVPAEKETGYLPDYCSLPVDVLNRTTIAYICSPANPQGAVASAKYWRDLIALAEQYDFKIFADECYSEIYRGSAPVGALQIAAEVGADPERIVIFNSLSKRSNLPGLRSGFCAGGLETMARIRQLRSYSGAPLPEPIQVVSSRIWADEGHVVANRALYEQKFRLSDDILGKIDGYQSPQAGFFLWLPVQDGEDAALKLWRETGVRVLPGAYLSREVKGHNPGKPYIRVALVAPSQEMQQGLTLLRDCLYE